MPAQTPNDRTKRLLFRRTAGTCTMCKRDLEINMSTGDPYPLGEYAHIETSVEGGPRYREGLSAEEASGIDNIILLCETCHRTIDTDLSKYTVEYLREIKTRRETECKMVFKRHLSDLTQAGIREIARRLEGIAQSEVPVMDYVLIPLKEKMDKNGLSEEIDDLLKQGLTKSPLVKEFLNDTPRPQMADDLRRGFLNAYNIIWIEGHRGDALFLKLWDYISGYSHNSDEIAASLAVMTYFFETCEAFEK